MNIKETYYIERNGVNIWLGSEGLLKDTDKIVEKRNVLVADEGYTLSKDGQEIGECVWLKDTVAEDYEEKALEYIG